MTIKKLVLPLLLLAVLVLCAIVSLFASKMMRAESMGEATMAPSMMYQARGDFYDTENALALREESSFTDPAPSTAGQTAAESDQKIIRTGSLVLVVEKVEETVKTIGTIAEEAGGYMQSSNVSELADGTLYGSMTIRIPSGRFSETVTAAKNLATLVPKETTNAQDVTEEYTDLDAQLRNTKAQEAEYLQILARAESVQDILAVQSYLSGTRAQIEQLQGRLQYLENRTAYATLSIELTEEPSITAPTQDFRPGSAVHEAIQALVVLLQGLVVLGIWTIIIGGPFIVLLGLIVFLCVKLIRRLMKNTK